MNRGNNISNSMNLFSSGNSHQQDVGQAWVDLQKPYYSPGEQINGYVNLRLTSSIPSSSLLFEFRGEEFVNLVKMETETYERINSEGETVESTKEVPRFYSKNRVFYNFSNPLSTFQSSVIPPGQYSIPISFLLSPNNPSTFKHTWRVSNHQCDA